MSTRTVTTARCPGAASRCSDVRPLTALASEALEARRRQGLLRDHRLRPIEGPAGPRVSIGDKTKINFASNGYLGLSLHPEVVGAMQAEAARSGTSATASRLVVGNLEATVALEQALADLKGAESALVMSSGYHANVGVLQALGRALGPGAVVLSDALNHASIVDGCRLAGTEVAVYPHRDVDAVADGLAAARSAGRRAVVITESRFSMDGDIAPLPALARLCAAHGAALIVDEAHATGIDGDGRGLVHAFGLSDRVDLIVGTLGKALGAHGAFVAGDRAVVDWLANAARTFVYTTALPAPVAAAATAALRVLRDERPDVALQENLRLVRRGLAEHGLDRAIAPGSSGPIVPLIVGAPSTALQMAALLDDRDVLVVPIRPPTVPEGTSRLRITVRADHDAADIQRLLDALEHAHDRLDLRSHRPRPRPRVASVHPPRAVGHGG